MRRVDWRDKVFYCEHCMEYFADDRCPDCGRELNPEQKIVWGAYRDEPTLIWIMRILGVLLIIFYFLYRLKA